MCRCGYWARVFLPTCLWLVFLTGRGSADWIYALGNSLTNDTLPLNLAGNIQNGIYCNQNLQQIFDDPTGYCTAASIQWDTAFAGRQFDWVMVQPFNGTSLLQDAGLIQHWMSLQPHAQFVMHTGWAWHSRHEAEYHGTFSDDAFHHNPQYFTDLEAQVEALTGRSVISTRAIDIRDLIYHDIEAGTAPYASFDELFRDWTHANRQDGRFLMHNAVRRAMGQPYSAANWPDLPIDRQQYLISAIERAWTAVPEPTCFAAGVVLSLGLLAVRRRVA